MKIDLHKNPRSLLVGDLALFEAKSVNVHEQEAIASYILTQKWFGPIAKAHGLNTAALSDEGTPSRVAAELCWLTLQSAYDRIRETDKEPDWLKLLPLEAVRRLEKLWLIGDGPDQYKIVPILPHTGFGYVVLSDGLVEQIDEAFGLPRLNGVAQLGLIHDPTVSKDGWRQYPQSFRHTRYLHSLDVHAIATLIGKTVDLSEEQLLILRVATQSHDALTPAGGDSIKAIDNEAFDEDKHYPDLFKRPEWKKFRDGYGLSETELAKIILGQGLLGSILDVSDKLAYVGRDLEMFLRQNPAGQSAWENYGDVYDRITTILGDNHYPCSVWECTCLVNGELVFTDSERLADFLCMRALMFKILYNNASARFYEAGFAEEVVRDMYLRKVLTRNALVNMIDVDLSLVIGKELAVKYFYNEVNLSVAESPRVLQFETKLQAFNFERQLAAVEPETMTHYEFIKSASTSCLQTFKVLHDGYVVPFGQACPAQALDVASISGDSNPHKVFVYDLSALCKNAKLNKRLLRRRNTRIKE